MSDWIEKTWPGSDGWEGTLTEFWPNDVREILQSFCAEVNSRAELNMLKTGTVSGAHYNAMQQILKELEQP